MRDVDIGKRMHEELVLEQLLESYPAITGRETCDEWDRDFARVEGSPDFVLGFDGRALGIELAEIRDCHDSWTYYETASRLAWQKHESYARRGLFANPIALILYSDVLSLFDIRHELCRLVTPTEFAAIGFIELWAIDFSETYCSAGHPLRRPDIFCFKPEPTFGFHRTGKSDRKPYG